MDEQELDSLFTRIAEVVADIIPEEWLNVYLYGEVVEGAQTAYFYYQSASKGEYIYSHRIPELTGISESEYSHDFKILVDIIKELWTETKHSQERNWTNFTMVLEKTGRFHIDFNYDDLSEVNPHERKTIWNYSQLGIMPKSNSGKEYLDKYLSSLD